jgi:hypothetical protein
MVSKIDSLNRVCAVFVAFASLAAVLFSPPRAGGEEKCVSIAATTA